MPSLPAYQSKDNHRSKRTERTQELEPKETRITSRDSNSFGSFSNDFSDRCPKNLAAWVVLKAETPVTENRGGEMLFKSKVGNWITKGTTADYCVYLVVWFKGCFQLQPQRRIYIGAGNSKGGVWGEIVWTVDCGETSASGVLEEILPESQSINGLKWLSQLKPRTRSQDMSRVVT